MKKIVFRPPIFKKKTKRWPKGKNGKIVHFKKGKRTAKQKQKEKKKKKAVLPESPYGINRRWKTMPQQAKNSSGQIGGERCEGAMREKKRCVFRHTKNQA